MYDHEDRITPRQIATTFVLLSLLSFSFLLTSCAGNKTEITLTGNSNTINTAATTDKKSDTNLDATGAGAGNGGVTLK